MRFRVSPKFFKRLECFFSISPPHHSSIFPLTHRLDFLSTILAFSFLFIVCNFLKYFVASFATFNMSLCTFMSTTSNAFAKKMRISRKSNMAKIVAKKFRWVERLSIGFQLFRWYFYFQPVLSFHNLFIMNPYSTICFDEPTSWRVPVPTVFFVSVLVLSILIPCPRLKYHWKEIILFFYCKYFHLSWYKL